MNFKRSSMAFLLLFFIVIFAIYVNPVYADKLIVSLSRSAYALGATINIHGTLISASGSPETKGLVAIQVVDILGNPVFTKIASTGTNPPPWKVNITEFLLCDIMGNPQNSFNRGSLAFFMVTVESLDSVLNRPIVLVINLLDSVGVSIAIACTNRTLAPKEKFTFSSGIYIPSDAYCGEAKAYVSVLTGWPKDGGYPYCPEAQVNFTILGGQVPPTLPSQPQSAPGSFNISFKLPNSALIGKYSVYTSARYGAWSSTTFTYMWLRTDVDTNGKVDILDISIAAKAYGKTKDSSAYNPVADVNEDGVINILDVTRIALDFGKKRYQ